VSKLDLQPRLQAVCAVLAGRMPAVLGAMVVLLEAVLEGADTGLRTVRTPTAPVALTAAQVLEAARTCGIPVFGTAAPGGERLILLASLGLDLSAPAIRAGLVEMHTRGEILLVRIENLDAARADLVARGCRADLVEASALDDGTTTVHAVAVP
jgi:hypothetical protein